MGNSDHGGTSLDLDRLGGWLGSSLGLGFLCEFLEQLCASGLHVEGGRLHPGVVSDRLDVGALVTLVGEEAQDQVLEVVAEASAVHLLEVGVRLALEEQVVEVFLLASLLEGEDALHDDEQDNSN